MYEISAKVYNQIAERLLTVIGYNTFFSGVIAYTDDEIEYKLSCTVIIYHQREPTNGYESHEIENIIPVWWEFSTTDGTETLNNDFSFRELLKYII